MEFVKRSTPIFKFSKQEVGIELIGKFSGTRTREVTEQKTGELKEITDLLIETNDGKVAVARDTGLRVAMSSADVKEGETIKIVKKEQEQVPNSTNRVNCYDIFVAQ